MDLDRTECGHQQLIPVWLNMRINGRKVKGLYCRKCATEILLAHLKGGDNGAGKGSANIGVEYVKTIIPEVEGGIPGGKTPGRKIPKGKKAPGAG